ncbi:Protein of unknown function, partial [Gryllus bimaculatus]
TCNANDCEKVQKDINNIQIQAQCSKDVFFWGDRVLVFSSHHHLGVINKIHTENKCTKRCIDQGAVFRDNGPTGLDYQSSNTCKDLNREMLHHSTATEFRKANYYHIKERHWDWAFRTPDGDKNIDDNNQSKKEFLKQWHSEGNGCRSSFRYITIELQTDR